MSEEQPIVEETQEEMMSRVTEEVFNSVEEKSNEGLDEEPKETQETVKEEDSKTSLYAKLTAQDKEIRQLKQQIKTVQPDLKTLAKENPIKALQELGISVDDVFSAWAPNDDNVETNNNQVLNKEDNELLKLKEEVEKLRQEKEQEIHQQRVESEKRKIADLAGKDTNRWEIVNKIKPYDLVLEVAVEMYKNTNELPDMGEVLDKVEEYFVESYSPLLELQKFRSKIQKEEVKPEEPRNEFVKKEVPTLGATPPTGTSAEKELSDEERIAWAAEALLE